MYDGVFHGCELGSEGVGDTLICLKNIRAHPSASPAKEGINQCSYVFLAPVQSQISSIEVDKARVIDAEGKPFVPHKSAERLSRQIMRRFGSEDVTVGSECPSCQASLPSSCNLYLYSQPHCPRDTYKSQY